MSIAGRHNLPYMTDAMDACCQAHDACLGHWNPVTGLPLPVNQQKTPKQCDKDICKCLQALDTKIADICLDQKVVPPCKCKTKYDQMYNTFCNFEPH